MTTNEKLFQVNLWEKLCNIRYSLGSLEINFYFIMPATEACKNVTLSVSLPFYTPPPPSSKQPIHELQPIYKGNLRAMSYFTAIHSIWSNLPHEQCVS